MELLVIMAILSVLALAGAAALRLIPVTQNSTSAAIFKGALRQFEVQALTNQGAEMTWNGKGTLSIVSLGGNPVSKTYPLSHSVQITLNGAPFSCLVLNPQGFPDNGAVATCSESNPSSPLTWSISDGSTSVSFQ